LYEELEAWIIEREVVQEKFAGAVVKMVAG
jgi:hypothetical protein